MRKTRGEGVKAPQQGSEQLKNKHNEKINCELCGGQYTYRNRNVHFKTIMHQEAISEGVVKYAPKHRLIYCDTCDVNITKNNYSTHTKTKKHRDNLILIATPKPVLIGNETVEKRFDNYLDLEKHNVSDKHLDLVNASET